MLAAYSNAPGVSETQLLQWPEKTSLTPAENSQTLLMFLHPHCPCSRSSLRQLEHVLSRVTKTVSIEFIFYRPAHEAADWVRSDLWDKAKQFEPDVMFADSDGEEARHFNVTTSGHVCIFDQAGRCVFGGGITAGRGHEGDCAGSVAAILILNGKTPQIRHCPTYGCQIVTDSKVTEAMAGVL